MARGALVLMFLVMSVLSWFKFSLWNHWYRPKKFNIFLASRPSALGKQPSSSVSPQKGGRVAGKNDFITIPNSLSLTLRANVPSDKNFLFGSSAFGSPNANLGARGSSFGLVANLNLILFKSNLFLSLHHATRAINLGLIYINFNPVSAGKSNVSAFSVQPLNIISIVDFNNNSQNVRSKVSSTSVPNLRHVSALAAPTTGGVEGGTSPRAWDRAVNSVRGPRVILARGSEGRASFSTLGSPRAALGVGRVYNFHIFTGLQFWFGFSARVTGSYSSPFFFKALNFPYFLINPNIKSIIYLHPNADGSTPRSLRGPSAGTAGNGYLK